MPEGISVNRVGSMFTFFLQEGPVTDYASAKRSDTARFGRLFHFLLDRGIYFPPSQFEAGFLSAAHTEDQVLRTAAVIREFLASDLQ
jgi:glutamate-1-semialdehyde 2,1-aminomutase